MSNSFLSQAGFMISNENFDANPMTGADAIAPDETDTLAAAVSEINADEATLAASGEQIDTAAVVADGLETISEKVAAANEEGGIDESTAEIVEASVEAFLKLGRIGVKFKSLGVPSSESFSNKANRVQLGQATCEALNISASKIWKGFIEAIKKSIEWVRNYFNKIFGAAERLERRAQSLKEATTSLGERTGDESLENDTLYNAVRVNGQPVKAADLSTLSQEAKHLFDAQKKLVEAYGKVELGGGGATFIQPTPSEYGLKIAGSDVAKRVTAEADVAVYATTRFPGESVVYLAIPKAQGGSDGNAVSDYAAKVKAGSVNLSDKKEEGKTLKTLAISDIAAFATNIKDFAAVVTGYKRNLTDINNAKTKFINNMEKFLAKGDGKEKDDSKDEAAKKAKAEATIFRKLMDEPAASYASHSIRALSASLQYAELSARQYAKN